MARVLALQAQLLYPTVPTANGTTLEYTFAHALLGKVADSIIRPAPALCSTVT